MLFDSYGSPSTIDTSTGIVVQLVHWNFFVARDATTLTIFPDLLGEKPIMLFLPKSRTFWQPFHHFHEVGTDVEWKIPCRCSVLNEHSSQGDSPSSLLCGGQSHLSSLSEFCESAVVSTGLTIMITLKKGHRFKSFATRSLSKIVLAVTKLCPVVVLFRAETGQSSLAPIEKEPRFPLHEGADGVNLVGGYNATWSSKVSWWMRQKQFTQR